MGNKFYRTADIETTKFKDAVAVAKDMWMKSCIKHYEAHGDSGSCVLGAGIYIYLIPLRCRKPQKYFIISAYDVACSQGSTNWEYGRKEVLDYLTAQGIDAHYSWGSMD